MIYFCFFLVMVLSQQKCPGIEGRVCGSFLPSKDHRPPRCLCIACRGKSCTSDNCCEECHDWPMVAAIESPSMWGSYCCSTRGRRRGRLSLLPFWLLPVDAGSPWPAAFICGLWSDYDVSISVVCVCGNVCGSGSGRHRCPVCASTYCDAGRTWLQVSLS